MPTTKTVAFLDRLKIDATCTRGGTVAERAAILDASLKRRNRAGEDSPDIADDPTMFAWRVTLRLDGREHSADYYTGVGHAKPAAPGGYGQRVSMYDAEQWAEKARPTPPDARGVLHCLVSDALSWENARTFEDFAREYGYSEDSRRAERIYNACGETYKALLHFLPHGTDLADLLESLDG